MRRTNIKIISINLVWSIKERETDKEPRCIIAAKMWTQRKKHTVLWPFLFVAIYVHIVKDFAIFTSGFEVGWPRLIGAHTYKIDTCATTFESGQVTCDELFRMIKSKYKNGTWICNLWYKKISLLAHLSFSRILYTFDLFESRKN